MIKVITDKTKGYDAYNAHWNYCVKNDIPFIRIIPATKFAKVEFDISTMLDFFEISSHPAEFFIKLYECYVEFFKLPKDKLSCAGGSNNLIFTLYKEHAEIFANQLFDYLYDYTKSHRKHL